MEQKNYYSECQLNQADLVREFTPIFKSQFSLAYGMQVKPISIVSVIDAIGASLEFDTKGHLALMWTWKVTACDNERNEPFKQVWTLLYMPQLQVQFTLFDPQVWLLDKEEEIYQENRFMYAKVKGDVWSVGLIEQTEPVLSKFDALKFILAHKFVEEQRHNLVMPSLISADLVERGNHLYWSVANGSEFYELTDKARKLDVFPNEVRYYSYPECLGKKVYAGKEAFWHFDGGKLNQSKGEYLSDKEACKIYPQHIWKDAPFEHPLPLIGAHSEGIERLWLVAKSGPMYFIVSAHTGMLYVEDDCYEDNFIPADVSKDEGFIFE